MRYIFCCLTVMISCVHSAYGMAGEDLLTKAFQEGKDEQVCRLCNENTALTLHLKNLVKKHENEWSKQLLRKAENDEQKRVEQRFGPSSPHITINNLRARL